MAFSAVRVVAAGLLLVTAAGCGAPTGPTSPSTSPPVATTPSGSATSPSTPASGDPSASSGSASAAPFIASAQWRRVEIGGGVSRSSLQVRPTPAGRIAAASQDEATAWAEVVALRPDADTEGMRDQFDCHWRFARLVEPDKPSWNLEPWRPVVDEQTMINTGCNPGGPEI